MTPVQFILAQIPLLALLVAVLVAVRKDSLQTGKVSAQVETFAAKLMQMDGERAVLLKISDEKIATALKSASDVTSQREREIIEAVKGFQATVDDLKVAVANIQNMWTGERKLIERIRLLELELTDLRAEHRHNHRAPHESGKIVLASPAQDGAPRAMCGYEETDKGGCAK